MKRLSKSIVRSSDNASSLSPSIRAGGIMSSWNADSGKMVGSESQVVKSSKIGCSMPSGKRALKQPFVAKT